MLAVNCTDFKKNMKSYEDCFAMEVKCTIIIQKEKNWYVATDVISGVASQGKSIDESLANLGEALLLYYERALLAAYWQRKHLIRRYLNCQFKERLNIL